MEDVGQQQTETARERLAELMDRRREELGLLWNDVADRAGLTKEGLRTVRFGTGKMRPPTKRGLEEALQWKRGSIDRYLETGDASALEALAQSVMVSGPPGSMRMSAGAPAAVQGDTGADLVLHMDNGEQLFVQVKYQPHSRVARGLLEAIDEFAHREGGRMGVARGRYETVREIEEDPDLPDDVKRKFIEAYDLLRREAAEWRRHAG
ncbi:hypothetical protein [Microbispora rosea]